MVRGHEPNLRWRTFASEIIELAADLRVEMVVTVGALLADVPHTRPVQVVSSAGDRDLAERLGLNVSRYEGRPGSSASSATWPSGRASPPSGCGPPCPTT